jgi:Uma2 family endonuclease
MGAKVLMDVEEYLHTSFEHDCEYVDGEIVERPMPEFAHSDTQGNMYRLLWRYRSKLGVRVGTEIRIQITRTRYRVADIGVWRDDSAGVGIPTVPPFLIVEILSPEDRMVRVAPKIQEYLSIGVEWVWVIDPLERAALCYSRTEPEGMSCTILRTENPIIEIPLESAFDLEA